MNPLYGLVLGGGKSSRMQEDKSLISYHGKPQVEVCYELLQEFCIRTFVSNRVDQKDLPGHQGLPQLHDFEIYQNRGPLSGILSAMHTFPSVAWCVVACDLPYIKKETLQHLIANRNSDQMATAYVSLTDNLPEPLCAIWEPKAYPRILEFIKQDIRCPRKILIKSSDVCLLAQENDNALVNVNDQKERRAALQKLQGRPRP